MEFKDLTEEQWEATKKDLHFNKSELGDFRKKHSDLSAEYETLKGSKGTEYGDLEKKYKELETSNSELSGKAKGTILAYEGKILGLTDQDISEIVLSSEDNTESIVKKVAEKKASIDRRVEDYLKSKGVSSTILGKKDDTGTTFASSHRKKVKSDQKKYYDI